MEKVIIHCVCGIEYKADVSVIMKKYKGLSMPVPVETTDTVCDECGRVYTALHKSAETPIRHIFMQKYPRVK